MKKKGKVPKMKNQPSPNLRLSMVINPSVRFICVNCGSTCSKTGFLGLFGQRLCDNDKCPNSKTIFK